MEGVGFVQCISCTCTCITEGRTSLVSCHIIRTQPRSIFFLYAGYNYCATQHSPAKIEGTMQTLHAMGPTGCSHVRVSIL